MGTADIVQFTAPMYYVDKDEGALQVDVMRLGAMKGKIKVRYATEDGSGKAGLQYGASAGEIVMGDGEMRASIQVPVIQDHVWAPTLEFKLVLLEPENCCLGLYLSHCRVKLIDNEVFPSGKFRDTIEQGESAIAKVRGSSLFWEYFKLNFNRKGNGWKTLLTITLDQMQNVYCFWILYANIYMVDVLFNTAEPDTEAELWLPTREQTAAFIGATYILPVLILHIWDNVKVWLNLRGSAKTFIQQSLFRKYLNYSEESRASVEPADMELALIKDANDLAAGYVSILNIMQVLGKLLVMVYFVHIYNARALREIAAMPCVMLLFGCCRQGLWEAATALACSKESELIDIVNETCTKYRLIADYFQRPAMNSVFSKTTEELQTAQLRERSVMLNNDYITKWLAPGFIGYYVSVHAPSVISGEHSLGTFLTTIAVFGYIAVDFGDLYKEFIVLSAALEPLKGFTTYFNMATDLKQWRAVNRKRREVTKLERDKVLASGDEGGAEFRTDLIPIQASDVSYSFPRPSGRNQVFQHVTVSVPQGSLVAVVGPHRSGKTTFMRLLSHQIFPEDGTLFMPTHLRILHVSQEPVLLKFSAFRNLMFGCPNPIDWDPVRIARVLQALSMPATLELIQPDLDLLERRRRRSVTTAPLEKNKWQKYKQAPREEVLAAEEMQCMLNSEFDDEVEQGEEALDQNEHENQARHNWQDELTYSEKVKMHLARALIMNPEVLILQRPLHHYEHMHAMHILEVIKLHSRNRGLFLPEESVSRRRPRTVFFTPEMVDQAKQADVVWQLDRGSKALYQSDSSKLLAGFHLQGDEIASEASRRCLAVG